jgi:hypothetical protein
MQQWYEPKSIAYIISFSRDIDALIWIYESNGEYSTSYLYAIMILVGLPQFSLLCV